MSLQDASGEKGYGEDLEHRQTLGDTCHRRIYWMSIRIRLLKQIVGALQVEITSNEGILHKFSVQCSTPVLQHRFALQEAQEWLMLWSRDSALLDLNSVEECFPLPKFFNSLLFDLSCAFMEVVGGVASVVGILAFTGQAKRITEVEATGTRCFGI